MASQLIVDAAATAASAEAMRIRPLGRDRNGAAYYDLGSAELLAGVLPNQQLMNG